MNIPSWLRVYGDPDFRGSCAKEDACLSTFFNQLRKLYPDSYGALAFHPKNEGKRSYNQIKVDKMHGFLAGVTDVIIPASPCLVLELKRQDHTQSKWQAGQLDFMKRAHDAGSFVCLALGYDAAMQAFEDWRKIIEKQQNLF